MAQTAGAAAAGGTGGLLMQIIPIILIFVVFWFFLTKGDEIVTIGGLAGRIAEVSEQYVVIEISRVEDNPVTITMQRGAVQTVLPRGTLKSIDK